jgi:ribosomal protein S27AE
MVTPESKPPKRSSQKKDARDAHAAVHRALRTGELVRPRWCDDCGGVEVPSCYIVAHHDDYSRPLDVRWLCLRCHIRAHRPRRGVGSARYARTGTG